MINKSRLMPGVRVLCDAWAYQTRVPSVSARVSFRLKNQEAPFLIEAMTIPAPAMKMIVPRTGEIGIRSLVSADIRLFACVGDAESLRFAQLSSFHPMRS
jgi:hypothetical protein